MTTRSRDAACEEQLELQRNLYDELFAQTELLRRDRQQAIDALCQIKILPGSKGSGAWHLADAALRKLRGQP